MHESPSGKVAEQGAHAVRNMFDNSLCKMHYDLGADKAPWSVAHFSGVNLHGIDVYDDKGIGGRTVLRNHLDIAENPSDDFLLAMPGSARINLAQGGRLEYCGPGRGILFSTAKPFSSSIAATRDGGQYAQLLARVSGAMLRQRAPQVDAFSNFTFDTRSGAGKIVKSLFELAISEGAALSAVQSRAFSAMLMDAIANVVRDAPAGEHGKDQDKDRSRSAAKPSSPARVREQARECIDRNIANPVLDVAFVAQHCSVSPRYLHAAFSAVAIKVGVLIRETRLQLCRNALLNPALQDKSITEVAMRWGYLDPAHFSRAYKARFGTAPREDRRLARPGIHSSRMLK